MPKVILPSIFRRLTAEEKVLSTDSSNIAGLLEALLGKHPQLKPYIYTDTLTLAPHLSVFINGVDIRDLQGTNTQLQQEDEIALILATAGG